MVLSCRPRKELAPGLVPLGGYLGTEVVLGRRVFPGDRYRNTQMAGSFSIRPWCRRAGGGMVIMQRTSGSNPEAGNG